MKCSLSNKKILQINSFSYCVVLGLKLSQLETDDNKKLSDRIKHETGRGYGGGHQHFIDHYCSHRNHLNDIPYRLLYLRIQIALLSIVQRARTRPQYDEERE